MTAQIVLKLSRSRLEIWSDRFLLPVSNHYGVNLGRIFRLDVVVYYYYFQTKAVGPFPLL